MELRHLISFEKVAQYQSYSKAAQALFVSQPAITAHINELERELKTQLFYRNQSPVQITETGALLLDYVKQILTLVSQASDEVENYERGLCGVLDISVSESAFDWVVPYLDRFKSACPGIVIKLQINLSHLTMEKILRHEVRLGIVKTSEPTLSDPNFSFAVVGEDEGIMVFSPRNQLTRYDVIPPAVLKKMNPQVVIYGKSTDFGAQIAKILDQLGLPHDAGTEMNNSEAIKRFLAQSDRIAFLPRGLVRPELEQGLLVTRPVQGLPRIPRYSLLIYRRDSPLSVASKRFADYLLNALDMDRTTLP